MLKFLLALILCQSLMAQADNKKPTQPPKDDRWVRINLASFISSKSINRGAVFYPYITGFVGPGFVFFDKVNVRGPNIFWSEGTRQDKTQWNAGIRLINDGAPFIDFSSTFDEDTDYRASRSDSFEAYANYTYRFGFNNLFRLEFEVAKDVNTHEGVYLRTSFTVPVYKFTNIRFTNGLGSSEHNEFFYGVGSTSGLGHQDVEITYVLPSFPKGGMTFLSLSNSWVLQKENRAASLVRENDSHMAINVRSLYFF